MDRNETFFGSRFRKFYVSGGAGTQNCSAIGYKWTVNVWQCTLFVAHSLKLDQLLSCCQFVSLKYYIVVICGWINGFDMVTFSMLGGCIGNHKCIVETRLKRTLSDIVMPPTHPRSGRGIEKLWYHLAKNRDDLHLSCGKPSSVQDRWSHLIHHFYLLLNWRHHPLKGCSFRNSVAFLLAPKIHASLPPNMGTSGTVAAF